MLSKKECLRVNTTLTLSHRTLFQNFEKLQVLYRCTGLLRRSKPIQLDVKNETHFTQNLKQNGVSLLPASKSNKKRRK